MILNVSGRCDIVAFYMEWFMNRYRQGYVDVRNPFYPKQVSRIYFDDVDAILFCTKNPVPIVDKIKEIKKPILFHVTITPYHKDFEPGVINKVEIIEATKKISQVIGSENIYLRYDPIIINDKYTISYHIKAFNKLCEQLDGYVKHIIISFVDEYKNVKNNIDKLSPKELTPDDYKEIGINLANSAKKHNMTVQTCFEKENLVQYGFINKCCLDGNLAFHLTGTTNFKKWKSRNCGCIEMVDIGSYNTCKHFCRYCYANYDEKSVNINYMNHDPNSSLLIGKLNTCDIIKVRRK